MCALNSEKLRERFVGHSGKKILIVRRVFSPVPMEPVIQEFREQLAEELGSGMVRLMLCDFSTTTDVERTASADLDYGSRWGVVHLPQGALNKSWLACAERDVA